VNPENPPFARMQGVPQAHDPPRPKGAHLRRPQARRSRAHGDRRDVSYSAVLRRYAVMPQV